ncbi:Metacaspase-1 [Zea mays]|uniref:Metacaspase-1 n=2 Tax=Zea mays TaxID=4577 RepID=A0A8J8XTW3_MAIZE|nr:metacaspase-1 [Zea mays]AQL05897.1 Putative metacaspase family protein [Zea mays]PWZ06779.1 Metacaspase-1 [Zea mays]|eukprot:XP_008660008.1 metacaspase-1 [Zea mays]
MLMGNTWPVGMAGGNTAATLWCSHCGMGIAAPAPGSGSIVRCAFCRGVTRVEHQRGGVGERAMTTRTLAAAASLPRQLPVSAGPVEIPASYPRVSGGNKKRALLVGVSYTGTAHELKGTVNDVKEMRRLLCDRFGFPGACILELTEKESDPTRVPTRENLLRAMRWLVEGSSSGDSLVFHFSGHGVQKLDMNDDEVDGYNEALCPMDFERSGKILDDEINDTIVRPLGKGVKLHAIVDTCHSGTILDLPYLCRMSRTGYWQWENHARPSGMLTKRPNGGLAISISGCSDDQKSADASGFSDESSSIGAMTDSFIKAVEAEPGTTYGRLLSAMRTRIRDGQGSRRLPGRLGSFVRWMIPSSSVQEPQLCSSEMFDIYRKPFLL